MCGTHQNNDTMPSPFGPLRSWLVPFWMSDQELIRWIYTGCYELNRNEFEVSLELLSGSRRLEIALNLNMSSDKVDDIMRNLYRKLRVKSVGEACARMGQFGLYQLTKNVGETRNSKNL